MPAIDGPKIPLLDHGYIQLIETWGSDERIIEAARMSTDKGFLGWELQCEKCAGTGARTMIHTVDGSDPCTHCRGTGRRGDEFLLEHLYKNKHSTPFEFAGFIIEIQAPIMVLREWHRHRTQGYAEMSARYTPLPDFSYTPTRERIIEGARANKNKQAQGTNPLLIEAIPDWLHALEAAYRALEETYQVGLSLGIPKELARLVIPVGRYTRMRATCNLRNWLAFLTLRQDAAAQYEIRVYANEVAKMVKEHFPRTYRLYVGEV